MVSGIETWASINDCGPALSATDAITGRGENSGQQVERLIWDCPEGTAVEHLRLMGSGHGWPGVTVGPVWQRLLGPPTTLVDASEEAWLFASRFSR